MGLAEGHSGLLPGGTCHEGRSYPPSDQITGLININAGPVGPANLHPFIQEIAMAALPFDSAEIEQLVLRFNAVTAKEGMDISDLGGNASDDEVAATLQETPGDLSRDEIRQAIESMNDEQQDGLVALYWIGRGDADPEAWEQTKALARQQHEGLVSSYLLGQPDAGEFLTEGLEKMLEYGVD
jgi:hypothetical protein